MEILFRKNIQIVLLIVIICVVTILLRLPNNTINPNGLNVDEVAFGYNAYSILKTAKDEYGRFLPLTFESYGDYKNPVPIYALVPLIAIFGLNDFSVRFLNIIVATISIPVFYLFIYKLTKNKITSIVGIILLSISPWHIYFSRFMHENILVYLLLLLGTLFFLQMMHSKRMVWPILSAVFFSISVYTYYSPRLFVPLLILFLTIIYWKNLKANRNVFIVWMLANLILCGPILGSMILGNDSARAKMTYIGNDIELKRNILLEGKTNLLNPILEQIVYYIYLLFHWVRKYLNYLHPDFLFFQGLDMTTTSTIGSGVMYLFEAPFLFTGLIKIIKKSSSLKLLVIGWIILGLVPASLTLSEQNHSRTMLILPMTILLSSIGIVEIFSILKNRLSKLVFKICLISYSIFIIWNIVHIYFVFSIHFPFQRGEYFMEGSREAIQTVMQLQNQYQEVVFDPRRGTTGPNVVSVPHMYYLFYSKYNPALYQSIYKNSGNYHFDKVTVRNIEWGLDRSKTNTLFVASPWNIPEKDISPDQIVKKIYLKNGVLALMVIKSKQ